MHKIRTFARFILMLHDRSDRPTGLMPLEAINDVVVLRDEENNDLDDEIRKYFKRKGKPVRIMSRHDRKLRSKEDLFISLVREPDVNERYAAMSSRAGFKVGAHPVKYGVYDLVVSPSENGDARQVVVFEAVTGLLEKIR